MRCCQRRRSPTLQAYRAKGPCLARGAERRWADIRHRARPRREPRQPRGSDAHLYVYPGLAPRRTCIESLARVIDLPRAQRCTRRRSSSCVRQLGSAGAAGCRRTNRQVLRRASPVTSSLTTQDQLRRSRHREQEALQLVVRQGASRTGGVLQERAQDPAVRLVAHSSKTSTRSRGHHLR